MNGLPYVSRPLEACRRKCPSSTLRKALGRHLYRDVIYERQWVLVTDANRIQCWMTHSELDFWRVGVPFVISNLEPGPYFLCPIEYVNEGYPERGIPVPARLIRGERA